jgi:hypothetical protein
VFAADVRKPARLVLDGDGLRALHAVVMATRRRPSSRSKGK